MREKIVLLLVVAALTVLVVASATAVPAGAEPKKKGDPGDKYDACANIQEYGPDSTELPWYC